MVNPLLLLWAREQSGYAVEQIARRLEVSPERLDAWENGKRKPTVRQAQKLANMYHRPFGVFFLPQPPSLPPLAAEYRRLPGVRPGVESPELRFAIRLMSLRRESALDLAAQLGTPVEEFSIEGHLEEGPAALAARLREALGVTLEEQFAWTDEWQALRRWREAVEGAGILVFQFPKVALSEARGLSLLDFPLPAIGINSREMSPSARTYALIHELAHVALAKGQEEQVALHEARSEDEWGKIERFAEETASAVLIPESALAEMLAPVSPPSRWTVEAVRTLSRKFKVTPLAMATRLRARGTLTWTAYREWRVEWNEWLETRPPRGKGFATPVGKTLGRVGEPLTRLVLHAMDTNRITAVEASRLLDLNFGHFDKLRGALRKGLGDSRREGSE